MQRYKGAAHFRQRIVMSTLSGRTVRIDEIRAMDEHLGLKDYEANFLRLVEKIVNGCEIVINETGTSIRFKPGMIIGGSNLVHDCGTSRAIGYFVEPLLMLAPFAKKPLTITLRGITNDDVDIGADTIRTVTLPMLQHYGLQEGLEFKILKRGAAPDGGGECLLKCPIVRKLEPINLMDEGLIKRIRGVAYSTRVAPQTSNRIVDSARSLCNHWIPDVWIYTDHYKGADSGKSPGFAVTLVAESTTGALLSAEAVGAAKMLPEDVGRRAAELLCEEIEKGGCVDTTNQPLALLLMALGPEDVSKLRLGKLSPHSITFLRHLKDFFGVTFQIKPDPETKTVMMSCRGIGFTNFAKKGI